ncbi:nitroreductase family deazaflavin-dependent oxidoreductase [Mycobacterium simiae]|uniref:Deazaflavin-dependent nitroreductase n=1 Tax=Mycobacterium simiae TaxID=1784 RepID=A0A1X0XYU8_MYCSI|nr:nitroreductase family deazaflavin-dependent oxidoreductase [Mycobacterium simiae]ORJ58113.1 deazaflavin-dependent nitroreductase [Mycobacterium simiae]
MTETPQIDDINAFNRGIVDEFRANAGSVGGPFAGRSLLLLTTTGAKTGQQRLSPLAYFEIDGKLIIIGSFGGAPKDPAWVHNLRANPRARVEIGADTFEVTAHELPHEERDRLLEQVAAVVPAFGEYQSKTTRIIPLFELKRV